jgi:hypothetical protein
LLLLAAFAGFTSTGHANEPATKSVCLSNLQHEAAPVIDGVLDDAVWSQATRIDDLHQFQPVDHGEPSEKSEFFIFYDEDFFYLAARLYDSDPEAIVARQMVQNRTLRFDDAIEILLDPFDTRRTGYWFQLNPNGIRRDGVYESPTEINRDWDGIWLAQARIDESGWTAEMAIPFKTLNFDTENQRWGFTAARTIARKKEEIAWSSYDRAINPGSAGTLDCITGIRQGRGLDVVPAVAAKQSKDFGTGDSSSDLEPSLDVYYKITPSLTAALTLNTPDPVLAVSAGEAAVLQPGPRYFQFWRARGKWATVLLTSNRPERGWRARRHHRRWQGLGSHRTLEHRCSRCTTGRFRERSQHQCLRRQGRRKHTGRVECWSHLYEWQSDRGPGQPALRCGFSLPEYEPEEAYGWRAEYPNSERWFGELGQWVIEENFNPAVGFVNRADIIGTKAEIGYTFTPNGRFLRNITFKNIFENIDNTDGDLESRELVIEPFSVETQFGDEFEIRLKRIDEVLVEEFEISPGVIIGTGDYSFDRVQFVFASALERRLALSLDIDIGDFYDGDLFKIGGDVSWRPGRHFYMQLGYEYNDVELPAGSFVTRLYRVRVDIAFTDKWSWLNVVQYDNVTDTGGFNSRLRYNPQAGQDLYLVLNRQFDVDPLTRDVSSSTSEVIVKFNYTFRF